jgi:Protein of unknown function (DUF3071)
MQELRFVAVSEDGSYAVLAVPGRSARFTLPIDERLRAVATGQTSRLAQYEIEVESPLRPKEIQARIRAGETAEEIADAAGIPVERVRWFEGPVLAERAYIADQAQAATVRRQGDSAGPGPRLGDIVPERMSAMGADPEEGQWDSRKRGDGNWQVQLTFSAGGRLHIAEWTFDPRRRHVMPDDDNAARLSLPESELPPLTVTMPGEATVTPLAPRLGAVSVGGMGGGVGTGPIGSGLGGGGLGGGRFRAERPVAADRAMVQDRPVMPERPAMTHAPAMTRPPYRDPAQEPPAAVPQPPATSPASFHDSERTRLTPQRPPVFEPEPDAAYGQPVREPAPAAWVPAREQVPAELPRPAQPRPAVEAVLAEAATAEAVAVEAVAIEAVAIEAVAVEPDTDQPAVSQVTAAEVGVPEAGAVEPAALQPAMAAPVAPAPEPAPAVAEPAVPAADEQEQAARGRPGNAGKKNARGRRSSVPSWDEIMLGSSPKRD